VERTRSEYRLRELTSLSGDGVSDAAPVSEMQRDEMAALLLRAYRGTIDDEGEDLDDARDAIDHYLGIILRDHSIVVPRGGELIAMCFVVVVGDIHYIDPVVVDPAHKRGGLGRACVVTSLRAMAADGITEVGATITDGNTASERLFAGLGFQRRGAWG
jgi:ribosomal protein S18 acetylase RimI-like enzyme